MKPPNVQAGWVLWHGLSAGRCIRKCTQGSGCDTVPENWARAAQTAASPAFLCGAVRYARAHSRARRGPVRLQRPATAAHCALRLHPPPERQGNPEQSRRRRRGIPLRRVYSVPRAARASIHAAAESSGTIPWDSEAGWGWGWGWGVATKAE